MFAGAALSPLAVLMHWMRASALSQLGLTNSRM